MSDYHWGKSTDPYVLVVCLKGGACAYVPMNKQEVLDSLNLIERNFCTETIPPTYGIRFGDRAVIKMDAIEAAFCTQNSPSPVERMAAAVEREAGKGDEWQQ